MSASPPGRYWSWKVMVHDLLFETPPGTPDVIVNMYWVGEPRDMDNWMCIALDAAIGEQDWLWRT